MIKKSPRFSYLRRRMSLGPTINNDDLDSYARRKEAENDIADLTRLLVCSSLAGAASSVRFRSGQGIRLSGYDGIVQATEGGLQVPQGNSVWELSAREDIDKKANEDYVARSNDPHEIGTRETAYVAVTMRKWPGKEAWAQEKKKEGIWADVVALDAGDLASWLHAAPAVEAWFRRHSGLQPVGIEDAEAFLEAWLNGTEIPLKSEILTVGRSEPAQKVQAWLTAPPSTVILRGDSIDEAVAFFCAVISALDEDARQHFLAKTVIVRDENSFRQALHSKGHGLILIPVFREFAGSVEAPKKGHHLLIPRDLSIPTTGPEVPLPRQKEEEISPLLTAWGLPEEKAHRMTALSRGRLSTLRRFLGLAETPDWANPSFARELVPFLLLGHWQQAMAGDAAIVEKYFGVKPVEFEALLLKWKNSPDAPIQQNEYSWEWRSRYESWRLLSSYLSEQDLKLFSELAKEVLAENDPTLGLPENEKWLAGMKGIKRKYSEKLREGITETIALLGNANTSMTAIRSFRVEDFASSLTHSILQPDWKTWQSLKDVLPNLAEASPGTFLNRIEESLRTKDGIAKIFEEKRDAFFGGIPQSGILWALETLAWDPFYLGRVCRILAKLQAFDNPKNNIGNRPIRSMKEILSSWHPQTLAGPDARIAVIKSLAKQEPDVAWDLIVTFFPRGGDSATNTHSAKWRESIAASPRPRAMMADLAKFAQELPPILIEFAHKDSKRWIGLLDMIEQLPDQFQHQVLKETASASRTFDAKLKIEIQQEVRDFLHRSRTYKDADWTIKNEELLKEADSLLEALTPTGVFEKHQWLFRGWPKFTDGSDEAKDYNAHQEKVAKYRSQAMDEILNSGLNPADFVNFMDQSDQGYHLGMHLADATGANKEGLEKYLRTEDPVSNPARKNFFSSWIFSSHKNLGLEWLEIYLKELDHHKNREGIAFVLSSIPCGQEAWRVAEKFGSDVLSRYWEIVPVYISSENWDDAQLIVSKLLDAGRVADVARIGSEYLTEKNKKKAPSPEQAMDLLRSLTERIIKLEDPIDDHGMFSYYLEEIFKVVSGQLDVDEDELAIIEWKLLPLLRHSPSRTKHLFKLLEKSPDTFSELVSFIYKSEDKDEAMTVENPPEEDDKVSARAKQAYTLLDNLWKGFPGRDENGRIDSKRLSEWVGAAREKLKENKRTEIGEYEIGKMLARSPIGADGLWPCEGVRDLIEAASSDQLGRGLYLGVINNRGVTTRNPGDGGKQELVLVEKYEAGAKALAATAPRTSGLLMELADNYRSEAQRHDISAERFK